MEFYIDLFIYILAIVGLVFTNLALLEKYFKDLKYYKKTSSNCVIKLYKKRYYKKGNLK